MSDAVDGEIVKKEDEKQKDGNEKNWKGFVSKYWMTIFVLLYLFSPLDLVPEAIIPVLGNIDDAIVVILEVLRQYKMYRDSQG